MILFFRTTWELRYERSELKFSDHRPVTVTYMVEVEVFSSRKLEKVLNLTDEEIENEKVIMEYLNI